MNIPGLKGERVRLVPVDKGQHLENFLVWMNDPDVTRYTTGLLPITRLAEEKWFERVAEAKDEVHWAVLDENNRHIGVTGIMRISWVHRTGITGTIIGDKSVWRKGYGSDIMTTRTQFAFEQMGLHRLESECFVENVASARCLEKAGYRKIGIARKRRWRDGQWHDSILWEILDEDYFQQR